MNTRNIFNMKLRTGYKDKEDSSATNNKFRICLDSDSFSEKNVSSNNIIKGNKKNKKAKITSLNIKTTCELRGVRSINLKNTNILGNKQGDIVGLNINEIDRDKDKEDFTFNSEGKTKNFDDNRKSQSKYINKDIKVIKPNIKKNKDDKNKDNNHIEDYKKRVERLLTIKTKDKVEILNEIDKLSYETGYNYKYIKSSTKSKIVMKFLCANQRFIEQDGILIPKNSKTSMALSNEITTNLLGKKRLEDSEIENIRKSPSFSCNSKCNYNTNKAGFINEDGLNLDENIDYIKDFPVDKNNDIDVSNNSDISYLSYISFRNNIKTSCVKTTCSKVNNNVDNIIDKSCKAYIKAERKRSNEYFKIIIPQKYKYHTHMPIEEKEITNKIRFPLKAINSIAKFLIKSLYNNHLFTSDFVNSHYKDLRKEIIEVYFTTSSSITSTRSTSANGHLANNGKSIRNHKNSSVMINKKFKTKVSVKLLNYINLLVTKLKKELKEYNSSSHNSKNPDIVKACSLLYTIILQNRPANYLRFSTIEVLNSLIKDELVFDNKNKILEFVENQNNLSHSNQSNRSNTRYLFNGNSSNGSNSISCLNCNHIINFNNNLANQTNSKNSKVLINNINTRSISSRTNKRRNSIKNNVSEFNSDNCKITYEVLCCYIDKTLSEKFTSLD